MLQKKIRWQEIIHYQAIIHLSVFGMHYILFPKARTSDEVHASSIHEFQASSCGVLAGAKKLIDRLPRVGSQLHRVLGDKSCFVRGPSHQHSKMHQSDSP